MNSDSRKRQKKVERAGKKKTQAQKLMDTLTIMKQVQNLLLEACVEHGLIEVVKTPAGSEYTIKEKSLYVEAKAGDNDDST